MEYEKRMEPTALEVNEKAFKNISNCKKFAMDIGGSLTKIAYFSSFQSKRASFAENDSNEIYSLTTSNKEVYSLNFMKFETKYISLALDYIENNLNVSREFNEGKSIKVTGGGAYKHKELIKQKLGVNVEKEDEMQCLINGCNFVLKHVPHEVFTVDHTTLKYEFKVVEPHDLFPYLLVNIGSGVSILKVDSEGSFQRVGGSTIGGATLWGLGSLLTDANGFDEIIELAESGDHRTIDMLVKDIYGGAYEALGLSNDLIASSLGKATRSALDDNCTREELLQKFKKEDVLRSILVMICYDISQIATLHARLNNVKRVYFAGYFIHGSPITMKFLKHGVTYWSQGQIECLFMRHEGYLGAIGAFLKTDEELDQSKYSWYENYARSSGISNRHRSTDSASLDCFELDQEDIQLVQFPLLSDSTNYTPDLIDLTKDEEARQYWLKCFENTIHTYEKQCMKSQMVDESCRRRAAEFKASYLNKLSHLRESPFAYGMLTVRSLLELREHCMSEFKFLDVYWHEKREENCLGLELLFDRISFIDTFEDKSIRFYHLFKGLLAGNVYDYGAQAFIQKREKGHLNEFEKALDTVEDNLTTKEGFNELVDRLNQNEYKSICLFVDNSGFDIVLGVLPLVTELLKTPETKVILCANSKPAINDITYAELLIVIKKASSVNAVLKDAFYNTKRLLIIETGSSSPCLDLSRINIELANQCLIHKVDLIILEGMGRAIHTNYDSKFKCDCLKIAVIKNAWLASRLFNCVSTETTSDSNKFPILFKYERV